MSIYKSIHIQQYVNIQQYSYMTIISLSVAMSTERFYLFFMYVHTLKPSTLYLLLYRRINILIVYI